MKHLARYMSATMAEIVGFPTTDEKLEELTVLGFVEFVQSDIPNTVAGQKVELTYIESDGKVFQVWTIATDESYYSKQIANLKDSLTATDYKVMKCYEATMVNEVLPYDIELLHSERQAIRVEINNLESLNQNL